MMASEGAVDALGNWRSLTRPPPSPATAVHASCARTMGSRSRARVHGPAFAMRRAGRMCRPASTSCVIMFCSHLVLRGAAMRSVQELVGHQDLTMTQRYSHLSPAALVDTVRLLETRTVESKRGEMLETAEGRDRKLKS